MKRFLSCARALLSIVTALATAPAMADVKLPAIFSDHMLLQRDKAVPVWGWAEPGEAVTVSINGVTANATTDAAGKWSVTLDSLKVSDQPASMTVTGKNTLEVKDVLIGDVWLCAGQSNMAWTLDATDTGKKASESAGDPSLRLYMAEPRLRFEPQQDCPGKWTVCTPATALPFSAVGYWVGHDLREHLKIPIGMIDETLGGTTAQNWTSRETLDATPEAKKMMADFDKKFASLKQATETYESVTYPEWRKAFDAWRKDNTKAEKAWEAAATKAADAGKPAPEKPKPATRPSIAAPPNRMTPTLLWNGMIKPILPYAIKGVTWYQGENNATDPKLYQALFPAMIADWRKSFAQGDFPFCYVQVSDNPPDAGMTRDKYPFLREAQTMALDRVKNVAMVVSTDCGDPKDVHYHNKQPVGQRLALAVLHLGYGESVPYCGPMLDHAEFAGDAAKVIFKSADGGLMAGVIPTESPFAKPADGPVTGFALAGADKVFHDAQATIDGSMVIVKSADVPQPVAVRYAFTDAPLANLYGKDGLPAVPFRTDNWEK